MCELVLAGFLTSLAASVLTVVFLYFWERGKWWCLYRCWSGDYFIINEQTGKPIDAEKTITITYKGRRHFSTKSNAKDDSWVGDIEMSDVLSKFGNGTYCYPDHNHWGLHQILLLANGRIAVSGANARDASNLTFSYILARK